MKEQLFSTLKQSVEILQNDMSTQDRINALKKHIEELERAQRNCGHVWNAPKYDPETVKVQDDRAGYEVHGSDRWPRLSFHDEKKDRWSRECVYCGLKEYTYTQKTTEVRKEPKF